MEKGTGLLEGDNLLNQIVNISKAGAYDVISAAYDAVQEKNENLKIALRQFIHAVEHEGVIEGRVVDAVVNAKILLKS